MKCIRPVYINNFQCDGKSCGSRCCKGWRVVVDDDTYTKYDKLINESDRQEIMLQLERMSDEKYLVKMKDNLECPFLDEDYLCKIQKKHGENYLTAICHSYPRVNYRLDYVLEQSLTLTCPIAARLILLPAESMEFEEIEIDEPRGIFDWTDKIQMSPEESVKIQATAISILQDRNLSLNGRLLKLCLLLNDDDNLNIERNFDINEHAKVMIDIFSEMYAAEMSEQKKINLRSVYIKYNDIILTRLMENYSHIFENYLVNEFFMRCYPYAFEGDLWRNCKIFTTGYKAMEFAITLTAISKNGFVTENEFLNMIDAVNEKLDHNKGGMKTILEFANKVNDFKTFSKIMIDY